MAQYTDLSPYDAPPPPDLAARRRAAYLADPAGQTMDPADALDADDVPTLDPTEAPIRLSEGLREVVAPTPTEVVTELPRPSARKDEWVLVVYGAGIVCSMMALLFMAISTL